MHRLVIHALVTLMVGALVGSCAKVEPEKELGTNPDASVDTDADTDSDSDSDTDTDSDSDTDPAECDEPSDCDGDPCVDGYCCDSPCDAVCVACNLPELEGTCSPVTAGSDPDDDCTEEDPSSCGTTGVCDGAGACSFYDSTTDCDDDEFCTTDDACDGAGGCEGLTPTDCDPGPSNQCCEAACDSISGCYTDVGDCTDQCDTNQLITDASCVGCGPANAEGICTGATVTNCTAGDHVLCNELSCGGLTYYCTNTGGTWEWRTAVNCEDGDDCSYNDACFSGSCFATAYTCTSDICTDRDCDGLGGCIETHLSGTTSCGTEDCADDYCFEGTFSDIEDVCTRYCDGTGICDPCTCAFTDTVCEVGTTNVCCEPACSDSSGCYTVSGSCGIGDVCTDPYVITVGSICSGCGAEAANGTCGGGGTFTCNATTHNECETVSCGGSLLYCTNLGGIWQWRSTVDCDDGQACTYSDECGGGSVCSGTPIVCTSTDCLASSCNGSNTCTEVPQPTTTVCGTTVCTADYCSSGSWHDYPGSCTSFCNGSGGCDLCSCTDTVEVCETGLGNECCVAACTHTGGCYTSAGSCAGADNCTDPNLLITDNTCGGCGANGAVGGCGGGVNYTCNATDHTACEEISCGGTIYYCTNYGGTWEWRPSNPLCNDGDLCTHGDYCSAGTCDGTDIICTSTDCMTRACNGTDTCTETPLGSGTVCGTTTCPPDGCISSVWHNYPATCNDTCDGTGNCDACTCTDSTTTCDVGSSNVCCISGCDHITGCYTSPGSCGGSDDCTDPNLLVTGTTCGGCGPNLANGGCGGGSSTQCNATNHTPCEEISCGGTAYYCTNFGGTWEWRTTTGCNDGDLCTYNDQCGGGTCSGNAVSCIDTDCVDRACDGTSVCVDTILTGASCVDSDLCTYNDQCNSSGVCVGGGTASCLDDDCNDRLCNGTSTCDVTTLPGHTCSDGDLCTYSDLCNASGVCVSGTYFDCDTLDDDCNDYSCDGTSSCDESINLFASCDDSDSCTTGTTCDFSGNCTGGSSAAVCPDAACNCGETTATCWQDCGTSCGDGTCNGSETTVTCWQDCGTSCGDGTCNGGENTCNCWQDCGTSCGDTCCNGAEDSVSCPADCGIVCSLPMTLATWDSGAEGWTYSDNWSLQSSGGSPGGYMRFDDATPSQKSDYSIALTSPLIDLSGCSTVSVQYDIMLNDYEAESWFEYHEMMYVQCSGNGSTWYTLHTYEDGIDEGDFWDNTDESFSWGAHTDALNAACLTATAYVRFLADGDDSWGIDYWGIDEVSLSGS